MVRAVPCFGLVCVSGAAPRGVHGKVELGARVAGVTVELAVVVVVVIVENKRT